MNAAGVLRSMRASGSWLEQIKENERRLKHNDRYLWEQAAIDVLGWLRKGEFLFAPPAGTTERAKE